MDGGFADCIYCGGQVGERTGTREVRWKGDLYVIEQVPMGVCNQCGERFVKPEVAKAIDRLLASGKLTRTVSVPVITYAAHSA